MSRVLATASQRRLAGTLLILVVTTLAYLPALRGEFILDDNFYLTDNRQIEAADGLYRFWLTSEALDYYPVSNSTLWLEWRLWGMQPTGYHLTNLAVHLGSVFLVWTALTQLNIPGAFLGALLFAVHPVNVESVAWIAQRKGLLALLFMLASLCAYIHATPTPPPTATAARTKRSPDSAAVVSTRWYAFSIIAFLLAMLSKGSVAILPLLLLLITWWRRPLTTRDIKLVAPFMLISIVLVPVNAWFQTRGIDSPIRSATFAERLAGAPATVWFYLSKALLPLHLSFIYPQWQIATDQPRWWLPLLAAVALTTVLWLGRATWSRPFFVAWSWFCIALFPIMGFTDVGFMQHSLVADHYQHVALIAVTALVAAGFERLRRHANAIGLSAATIAVGTLTLLTWNQSRLYAHAATLYEDTLAKNPGSWMAHTDLGALLTQQGRSDDAIAHYREALRLNPAYPEAHNNLGSELSKHGSIAEAIRHYQEALRLKPALREAHYNLAMAYASSGQPAAAADQLQQALRLKPSDADTHYQLAIALADSGQREAAIAHCRETVRLRPNYAEAYNNLASLQAQSGQLQEAVRNLETALRLKPDYADAQQNLRTVQSMLAAKHVQ